MTQISPRSLFFLGLAIIVAKGYASNAPVAATYPSGRSTRLPPPGRLVALVVVFTIANFLPERIGVPLDLMILAAMALAPGGIVLPSFEGFNPSAGTSTYPAQGQTASGTAGLPGIPGMANTAVPPNMHRNAAGWWVPN